MTAAPQEQRSAGGHVATALILVAVVGLSYWFLHGIVYRIFHLAELVVVAVACGLAGYRLGRGRRR